MGFKISWIAVASAAAAEARARLGLRQTSIRDEALEAEFCGAAIPDWYIIWSNDFTFATPARLSALSTTRPVVACNVHEGIMVSLSSSYSEGREQWSVVHEADRGIDHLTTTGKPPDVFLAIRDRLVGEQEAAGGAAADVDYIFDVPIELAERMTGFRYDQWRFSWGEPEFFILERET